MEGAGTSSESKSSTHFSFVDPALITCFS